jgi:hypothetical protein
MAASASAEQPLTCLMEGGATADLTPAILRPAVPEAVVKARRATAVEEDEQVAMQLQATINTMLASAADDADHTEGGSARPHKLLVILQHLAKVTGTIGHVDAVWDFVTSLVLRATYLDSHVVKEENQKSASVKGFDRQLEIGLRSLDRKLDVRLRRF